MSVFKLRGHRDRVGCHWLPFYRRLDNRRLLDRQRPFMNLRRWSCRPLLGSEANYSAVFSAEGYTVYDVRRYRAMPTAGDDHEVVIGDQWSVGWLSAVA
jgi:hypothetical protein